MTEEERQKLCEKLRDHNIFAFGWKERELVADEIERLAKELAELRTTFRAAAVELGDPRTRQHPERQKKF